MGGGEKLLLALHKAYPDAPIYTSVFIPEACPPFAKLDVRTTYLQHLPKSLRRWHQLFPVFRAHAFRNLDLSEYDIIISSASAEAKAVRARPGALHVCYCHTPTRYYWSHYEEYKKEPGFGPLNPLIRLVIPPFVAWMRRLDLQAVEGVDYFIANSHAVQKRIKQYYKRDSTVIFPPVQLDRLAPTQPVTKEDFYLIVGRQIPYKRFDLAIEACNRLGKRLILIGEGTEHERLKKIAGPTVQLLTGVDDLAIVSYFQKARGFIFPQQEDFGITAVEAMAAGTPVIAFGKDGALDSLIDGKTGTLFAEQTIESLIDGIQRFEKTDFSTSVIQEHAGEFSEERFVQEVKDFVKKLVL
jgi:glycosyltransferase involved in cell wall biosynthesis